MLTKISSGYLYLAILIILLIILWGGFVGEESAYITRWNSIP